MKGMNNDNYEKKLSEMKKKMKGLLFTVFYCRSIYYQGIRVAVTNIFL